MGTEKGICKLYKRKNGSIIINIAVDYAKPIMLDGRSTLKITTTKEGKKICIEEL